MQVGWRENQIHGPTQLPFPSTIEDGLLWCTLSIAAIGKSLFAHVHRRKCLLSRDCLFYESVVMANILLERGPLQASMTSFVNSPRISLLLYQTIFTFTEVLLHRGLIISTLCGCFFAWQELSTIEGKANSSGFSPCTCNTSHFRSLHIRTETVGAFHNSCKVIYVFYIRRVHT